MSSSSVSKGPLMAGPMVFGGALGLAAMLSAFTVGMGNGGALVSSVAYAFGLLLLPAAVGVVLVKLGARDAPVLRLALGRSQPTPRRPRRS